MLAPAGPSAAPSRVPTPAGVAPGAGDGFGEFNNEVFDPLGWMLDGLVDLPAFDINGGAAAGMMDDGMGS